MPQQVFFLSFPFRSLAYYDKKYVSVRIATSRHKRRLIVVKRVTNTYYGGMLPDFSKPEEKKKDDKKCNKSVERQKDIEDIQYAF